MANLSEDELSTMERAHRADETERCRLLCKMRGDIARDSAARYREAGSFRTFSLWPPRRITCVAQKWEQAAKDMDAVAHAFDVVATCIAMGYDPRKLDKSDAA